VYENEETGSIYESETVDFDVEQLDVAAPAEGVFDRIISWISNGVNNFRAALDTYAGAAGLLFTGLVLSILAGTYIVNRTESEPIGITTVVGGILFFTFIGWVPAWVGLILGLIAIGVGIYFILKPLDGGS